MNTEKEQWKPVKGYEGLYEVSNFGNIKSLNYRNTGKECILKNILNVNDYYHVTLCGKQRYVHKLVAETFIPNPENKPCIDHIIPISCGGTNCVENLRWCTHEENSNNRITKENHQRAINKIWDNNGEEIRKKLSESHKGKTPWNKGSKTSIETRIKQSESHKGIIPKANPPKKVYQYTLDGELVKIWDSTMECGRNGYTQSAVAACCRGIKKQYKGYIWSYSPL